MYSSLLVLCPATRTPAALVVTVYRPMGCGGGVFMDGLHAGDIRDGLDPAGGVGRRGRAAIGLHDARASYAVCSGVHGHAVDSGGVLVGAGCAVGGGGVTFSPLPVRGSASSTTRPSVSYS